MSLTIKQFKGQDWISNCYIVSDKEINNHCIIIDPGAEDITDYIKHIEETDLLPEYMIITHRHFDHFAGANRIRDRYSNVRLFCSRGCNEAIQNPRLNCSELTNKQKPFILEPAEVPFDGALSITWNEHRIYFVPTPGHTEDSVSILIDDNIFTGDALLKDTPTITKLPSGDKEKQIITEKYLLSLHGYKAWPGHGESFEIK